MKSIFQAKTQHIKLKIFMKIVRNTSKWNITSYRIPKRQNLMFLSKLSWQGRLTISTKTIIQENVISISHTILKLELDINMILIKRNKMTKIFRTIMKELRRINTMKIKQLTQNTWSKARIPTHLINSNWWRKLKVVS